VICFCCCHPKTSLCFSQVLFISVLMDLLEVLDIWTSFISSMFSSLTCEDFGEVEQSVLLDMLVKFILLCFCFL